jgi:hypothetical protein
MVATSLPIRRKGSIALVGMLILTIALLLLVWVVFSAQTKYLRERMQICADASALAAAEELVDDCWISGDANAVQDTVGRSREAANTYAKLNPIQGVAAPVFANPSNDHDGDICFGHFPLSGNQTFRFGRRYPAKPGDPEEDLENMDSVRIVIHRNQQHDRSQLRVLTTPTSPDGKLDGLAASIAVLDRYVYGFKPVGDQTTPFVPIALYSDPAKSNQYCWERRNQNGVGNDQFAYNRTTKMFNNGADGIPEFKVRLGLRPKDDESSVKGVLIRAVDCDITGDGSVDLIDVLMQLSKGGLRAEHLAGATFGGAFALDDNGRCSVAATDEFPQAKTHRNSLFQSLDELRKTGRAFVFPLYRTLGNGTDAVSVCDFVACRIVSIVLKKTKSDKDDEEEDDNGDDDDDKRTGTDGDKKTVTRSIVITLQHAMVSVPTAMTDARRTIGGNQLPANLYIAKVRLGR